MGIRIRLWQRLFIAFAGLSVLALATYAVLQQQSLRTGFLDYLNRLSLERVSDGARRLGERYDATGNWDFVRGRQGEFMRILGLPPGPPGPGGRGAAGSNPGEPPSSDNGSTSSEAPDQRPPPPGPGAWPPPREGPGGMRPPPPRGGPGGMPPRDRPPDEPPPPPRTNPVPAPAVEASDASAATATEPAQVDSSQQGPSSQPDGQTSPNQQVSSADRRPVEEVPLARALPPPPPDEPGRPPPRPAGPLDLGARLLLVDASDQYVVGNPEVPADSPAVSVMSHGQLVGRLLLAPMPKLRGDLDISFAQTQLRHALLMGCFVLLGALLLSWLLARWLLAPIRALSAGSRALVAGQFGTRVPTTRSDELGALAEDFNRLASTLEKNRDARRRWGADIAHELRTPIGILRGEIQALQDGIRKPGVETLASLQTECDRLAGLVEDLYQLSLSDEGALAYRFEPFDLGDLLREVVQSHAGAMKDAGLELSLDASPVVNLPVLGDGQRLMQLFGNLLRNSIRYTTAPGKVRIAARRVGSDCVVEVEDTPPGVPQASLAHLFDRLYRVEASRSREFGGAGLGLAICRNIVLAHGGNIVATPASLGGLCIGVRLPLAGGFP